MVKLKLTGIVILLYIGVVAITIVIFTMLVNVMDNTGSSPTRDTWNIANLMLNSEGLELDGNHKKSEQIVGFFIIVRFIWVVWQSLHAIYYWGKAVIRAFSIECTLLEKWKSSPFCSSVLSFRIFRTFSELKLWFIFIYEHIANQNSVRFSVSIIFYKFRSSKWKQSAGLFTLRTWHPLILCRLL